MKFTKTLLAVVLVLAMALSMSSFAFAEGVTLKIGFIGPLTGAAADYGMSAKQGAEIAVAEINAKGGIQIEFNAQDDEHDAEKSVNAYNNLLDWGCQMIDGTVTTTPCMAVGTQANEDRVFMLTPSASNPDVAIGKDNVYQICFTDPAQGTASAQYIAQNGLPTNVAVIYNNADSYSTGIYQTFVTEAEAQGLTIVATETFTDDTTDFSVQVSACKDAGAELVFLPIYYTPASMIFQQAVTMEYAPIFFGVDGMDGILTLENFDLSLAEGVMLLTPFSAKATDEKTVNFVNAYEGTYGETPNQFAADGYDCVYAYYQALTETGASADMSNEELCDLMIEAFTTMTFDGLTGKGITWGSDGVVAKTPNGVIIEDGAYVDIK